MAEPQQPSVRIHYLKSGGYRAIHVDGAVCGFMPSGRGLHVAFFSERAAIPQIIEHALNTDGSLGTELARLGKDGVVREIEIDAFMDLPTAKSLLSLMTTKVAELDQMINAEKRS